MEFSANVVKCDVDKVQGMNLFASPILRLAIRLDFRTYLGIRFSSRFNYGLVLSLV